MKNIIIKLLKNCNLGELTEEPTRIYGGLLNRMYKVKTTIGTYAIKHLNPEVMKRETALSNHIFAEKIANLAKENGVSCLPAKIFNNSLCWDIIRLVKSDKYIAKSKSIWRFLTTPELVSSPFFTLSHILFSLDSVIVIKILMLFITV